MIDMKPTIIAKSDQMNADDLMAGGVTIKITAVRVVSSDQPAVISYEGDNGKPWKPCKSMCRVLILVWGDDGEKYVGQSLTLFRDSTVKWAGAEVGGIRISHMTGINERRVIPLTVTRGSKKPYTIEPLIIQQALPEITGDQWAQITGRMDQADTEDSLKSIGGEIGLLKETISASSIDKLKHYYSDRLGTIRNAE